MLNARLIKMMCPACYWIHQSVTFINPLLIERKNSIDSDRVFFPFTLYDYILVLER